MFEKRFAAIPPQSFIADGTTDGVITVADTRLFKVKQEVYLTATSLPNLDKIEVKSVISLTQLAIGPKNGSIKSRTDVSLYTTALSAVIGANEQDRPNIGMDYHERANFEEEPTVADRVILVDELGNKYNAQNPLPIAATFDGDVTVGDIRITADDNDPKVGDIHSSIRIGDGNNEVAVNPDGSINVVSTVGARTVPLIANFPVVLASTEYSYTFPATTKKFSIKDRDGNAKTRIAFTSGDTNSKYITLDMGCTHVEEGLSTLAGFTVYFQSNKAGRTIEILSWT